MSDRARPLALALALAPVLLLPAAGCVSSRVDPRVFLTSEPPGADVALDGVPTGKTTPVVMELRGLLPGDREVTFSKEGFEPETRRLVHHKILYTSRWLDGAADESTWPFFLWWTFGDLFFPIKVRWRYEPRELHVRLYRQGEFALR